MPLEEGPVQNGALSEFAVTFTDSLEQTHDVPTSRLREAAAGLWPLVRGLDNIGQVTELLRHGGDRWLTAAGLADQHSGERLEQLLLETIVSLSAEQGRDQFGRLVHLLDSLTMQYNVGMDLLRSHQQEPTRWAGSAVPTSQPARSPCPIDNPRRGLMIRGVYDPRGDDVRPARPGRRRAGVPAAGAAASALRPSRSIVVVVDVGDSGGWRGPARRGRARAVTGRDRARDLQPVGSAGRRRHGPPEGADLAAPAADVPGRVAVPRARAGRGHPPQRAAVRPGRRRGQRRAVGLGPRSGHGLLLPPLAVRAGRDSAESRGIERLAGPGPHRGPARPGRPPSRPSGPDGDGPLRERAPDQHRRR